MTDWIVFDVGGIVVYEAGDVIDRSIAGKLGIPLERFQELARPLFDRATSGEITLGDMYRHLVEQVDSPASADELLEHHLSLYHEHSTRRNPDVLALVADLRTRFHVACLTNTEPEIAALNLDAGLFDPFERAFLSTELKMRKPQLEIYRHVLAELQCEPENAVYIDDRQAYVDAAAEVGMHAVLFRDAGQIRGELSVVIGEF